MNNYNYTAMYFRCQESREVWRNLSLTYGVFLIVVFVILIIMLCNHYSVISFYESLRWPSRNDVSEADTLVAYENEMEEVYMWRRRKSDADAEGRDAADLGNE